MAIIIPSKIMKEFYSTEDKKKYIKNHNEIDDALNQLMVTQLKRKKLEIDNKFLREASDNFDYLPINFKERFMLYLDNKLDQSSPFGQELRKELDEILKKRKLDEIELADYEVID